VSRDILRYRRIRVDQLMVSQDLSLNARNLLPNLLYRARDLSEWPQEIISEYIALHPPVVIARQRGFHAIGNFRSVELAGYLDPKTRVSVLEHAQVPQHKLLARAGLLEFLTISFGALCPAVYEQSVLPLWELSKSSEGFPESIHSKQGLARFLSGDRKKFSRPKPEELQPTYRRTE